MTTTFAALERRKTALLTTYKRNGSPVATPVTVAVDGDRAYIRTPHAFGKAQRLRHNPTVEIAPSTLRGKPRGPTIRAHARRLDGEQAARALACRAPLLQGVLVPLVHRLERYRTLHYELTPCTSVRGARMAGPASRQRA
jgi:PPOX class probable F420-dependent enzyme